MSCGNRAVRSLLADGAGRAALVVLLAATVAAAACNPARTPTRAATGAEADLLILGGTETTAPEMHSLWGEQAHQERRGLWAMFLPLTYSPWGGIGVAYLPGWPRAADVEFGASAGVGFHVGLSPGELLDFLLGLSTLDVAGDDVPLHPPTPQPAEGNPPVILWPRESSGPSWAPR